MPRTRLQSVVFTLMMVFCMVFCMTVYSISLNAGVLEYITFLVAVKEMWVEYAVVFALIFFLISPRALKLGQKLVNPESNNPLFTTLAIQSLTVVMIVPAITLVATFLHNGLISDWLTVWITTACKCFPAAFCLQVFFVGPFVRKLFRTIFRQA